jgi:hypothetical protein
MVGAGTDDALAGVILDAPLHEDQGHAGRR